MKKITSFSVNEETLREIDQHPIVRDASRSAFVRVCISEKLERERKEEGKNEKSKEE